jgi:hypothetical protein
MREELEAADAFALETARRLANNEIDPVILLLISLILDSIE